MRLSRKSEYACLALIYLSEHQGEGLVRIDQIAQKMAIPRKYLEQILVLLNRAGYLRSMRGAGGGYRLAKKPEEITVAEVIRLIDGPLAPVESASKYFYEPTPVERSVKLITLFREIRDFISERLEHTTFADLL